MMLIMISILCICIVTVSYWRQAYRNEHIHEVVIDTLHTNRINTMILFQHCKAQVRFHSFLLTMKVHQSYLTLIELTSRNRRL